MRKIVSILLGFAILPFAGCDTADQKIPEIAAGYCNCFTDMEKNMSSKTKDILEKGANAADPQAVMVAEVAKLSQEEQMTVGTEMMAMGELKDKNSKVGKCVNDVDEKYGKSKTYDKEKFMQKLVKELESKTGCNFTAMIMKMGLRLQEKKK
jgi:hypothetical protein